MGEVRADIEVDLNGREFVDLLIREAELYVTLSLSIDQARLLADRLMTLVTSVQSHTGPPALRRTRRARAGN